MLCVNKQKRLNDTALFSVGKKLRFVFESLRSTGRLAVFTEQDVAKHVAFGRTGDNACWTLD